MNVANLQNCKRLYELTAWGRLSPACFDETDFVYYSNGGEVSSDTVHYREMVMEKDGNIPAYDLGYLLRKLPEPISITTGVKKSSAIYLAFMHNISTVADTPEDALTLLAIKLFEDGILTRDTKGNV